MLTVELVLIIVGWLLVVGAVLVQLPRLRGIRMPGRGTSVPTSWTFVVLLIIGVACCEVGAQLGKHGSLGRWGFVLVFVPIFAFVAVTSIVYNRRLSADSEGRGGR